MKVSMFILENDRLVNPNVFKESYTDQAEMMQDIENSGFTDVYVLPVTTLEDVQEFKAMQLHKAEQNAIRLKFVQEKFDELPEDIKKAVTPLYEKTMNLLSEPDAEFSDIFRLAHEAIEILENEKQKHREETHTPPNNADGEETENKTDKLLSENPSPQKQKRPRKAEKKESKEIVS
jgi:hypothetical protein